ncbi:hypothetical protein [Wenyingzhuangia sp. IMCC45574]
MKRLSLNYLYVGMLLLCCCFTACEQESVKTTYSKSFFGDYEIESQAVLNEFASNNFTRVRGSLFIFDCEDLSPLSLLTTIDGKLEIRTNKVELERLNGLENITSVGGDLNIYQNRGIKSLEGLDNLKALGGNVSIYENSRLETLSNLDGLARITGFVNIYSNPNLVSLDGLNEISEVSSHVDINNNKSLTHLNGFKNITSVGNTLGINSNQALIRLDGFNHLISVESKFEILENRSLVDISSLQDLTSVGALSIKGNSSLKDFCVLNTVNFGESYAVSANGYNPKKSDLEDVEGCSVD